MNAFAKLLADLSAADVEFIVVGGVAVALAGYLRATEDIDVLIRTDEKNIRRLLDALEDFGEGHARELSPDDFALEEGAVRIVEDFPLNLFTQMGGRTYEDLLPLTDEHVVGENVVRYLNTEGLILLKKDSLRPKDQLDVQALRDIQRRKQGGQLRLHANLLEKKL